MAIMEGSNLIVGGAAWRAAEDWEGFSKAMAWAKAVIEDGVKVSHKLMAMDWGQEFKPSDASLLFDMYHRMASLAPTMPPILKGLAEAWLERKFVDTAEQCRLALEDMEKLEFVIKEFLEKIYLPHVNEIAAKISWIIDSYANREPTAPVN